MKHRLDYLPPEWTITTAFLDFILDPKETKVHSKLFVEKTETNSDNKIFLDGIGLNLESFSLKNPDTKETLDAEACSLEILENGLSFVCPWEKSIVETNVTIHPNQNTALEGLYTSGPLLCTQCEPEGFRHITYFIDRPDVLFKTHVTLTAGENYPILLSNGNCLEKTEIQTDSGKLYHSVWEDPIPKPSYLFALVAGNLESLSKKIKTQDGKDVELAIWVEPGQTHRAEWALTCLEDALRWDEQRWGRCYDLNVYNVVAVSYFNMGAMENKGLNIFNDKYVLADSATATDNARAGIQSVIGHEYFHNWTGNRITCRDWFQLTLKEGLTVFRDQEFSSDLNDRDLVRYNAIQTLRTSQYAEDSGPTAHPIRPDHYSEINNFYTSTVYNKGAEIIRMMQTLVGAEKFRAGMDHYFETFDGQAVTCDDFVSSIEQGSGYCLQNFKKWYSQTGTPHVDASWHHTENGMTLTLKQDQNLVMPVVLGWITPSGQTAEWISQTTGKRTQEEILVFDQPEQTWHFKNIPPGSLPSLFRNLSAPILLSAPMTEEESLHLIEHDTNFQNQMDALTSLKKKWMQNALKTKNIVVPEFFWTLLKNKLKNAKTSPEKITRFFDWPSLQECIEPKTPINPEFFKTITETLFKKTSESLHQDFITLLETLPDPDVNDHSGYAAGCRALRNRALGFITEHYGMTDHLKNAIHSKSFTVQFGALSAAVDTPCQKEIFEIFEKTWDNTPLALDYWMSLQACYASLEDLERLKNHPHNDPKNPNRMRAFYGSWAGSKTFHQKDGSGYRKFAEIIKMLDVINGHMAASFAKIMTRAGVYEEPYKTHMIDALLGLEKTPCSTALSEIIDLGKKIKTNQ